MTPEHDTPPNKEEKTLPLRPIFLGGATVGIIANAASIVVEKSPDLHLVHVGLIGLFLIAAINSRSLED